MRILYFKVYVLHRLNDYLVSIYIFCVLKENQVFDLLKSF